MYDYSEMNTPKSDKWIEIVNLINGFGNEYRDENGFEVNTILNEHYDLKRLLANKVGSDEDETQEQRDAELEACVTEKDLNVLLQFREDLNVLLNELEKLIEGK